MPAPAAPSTNGKARAAAPARDHHDEETDVGVVYNKRALQRLLTFARPHRRPLLGSVALLVLGMFFKLAGPWIVRGARRPGDGRGHRRAAEGAGFDPTGAAGHAPGLSGSCAGGRRRDRAARWLMNRTGQHIVFELRNRL